MSMKNNSACFKHSQCSSGFCRKALCSDPTTKHDPCNPLPDNCPRNLQCSKRSRTCVPFDYEAKEPCRGSSDCSYNEYCIKGRCIRSLSPGNTCKGVDPDLCAVGSKCMVYPSFKDAKKCYELCSSKVPCRPGYDCLINTFSSNSVCVAKAFSPSSKTNTINPDEIVQAILIVLTVLILILGGLYGWIRLTRSGKDPRLLSSKDKKKRKRLRLNIEGNGLATITLVPSTCQSPQPVAASQLFSPIATNNYMDGAPPAYSEIINIR